MPSALRQSKKIDKELVFVNPKLSSACLTTPVPQASADFFKMSLSAPLYSRTITLKVSSSSTNPESAVFQIDSNDSFNAHQHVTYTATIGAPKIGTVIANGGDLGNDCAGSFADLHRHRKAR
jgi:hypothetical protein